jgi:hypothetical protein
LQGLQRQVHSKPLNGIQESFSEEDDMTGEEKQRFVFRTRGTFKSRLTRLLTQLKGRTPAARAACYWLRLLPVTTILSIPIQVPCFSFFSQTLQGFLFTGKQLLPNSHSEGLRPAHLKHNSIISYKNVGFEVLTVATVKRTSDQVSVAVRLHTCTPEMLSSNPG